MNTKARLIVALCTLCVVGSYAEPRGWGLGLGTFDGDFGGQARKDLVFGDELQYSVDLQAGLYHQRKWTGRVDVDFHYLLRPDSTFSLYPLAGIDIALRNKSYRAGANIGGGALIDLNADTSLFFEGKYVAGDWSGFAFTIGVYF